MGCSSSKIDPRNRSIGYPRPIHNSGSAPQYSSTFTNPRLAPAPPYSRPSVPNYTKTGQNMRSVYPLPQPEPISNPLFKQASFGPPTHPAPTSKLPPIPQKSKHKPMKLPPIPDHDDLQGGVSMNGFNLLRYSSPPPSQLPQKAPTGIPGTVPWFGEQKNAVDVRLKVKDLQKQTKRKPVPQLARSTRLREEC